MSLGDGWWLEVEVEVVDVEVEGLTQPFLAGLPKRNRPIVTCESH